MCHDSKIEKQLIKTFLRLRTFTIEYINANGLTTNRGDFSAHRKYNTSITSINENLGNQDGSWIIISHGVAHDAHKFPMGFSWILYKRQFVDGIRVYCIHY